MNFLRLPCAGKLGNCPKNLHRFHATCFTCRWRRKHIGKWTDPPYWIDYTIPWLFQRFLLYNPKTKQKLIRTDFVTLKIDPRGHCAMLRCSAIITLLKIAEHFPEFIGDVKRRFIKIRSRFITVCELIANITIL